MEIKETAPYQLTMTNREYLLANGIVEVESFDENVILLTSKLGTLVIKGHGLHILQLNLDDGKISLQGEIDSVQYQNTSKGKLQNKGKGIMERLFK